MATHNDARKSFLDQVGSYYDRVSVLLSDAKDGTHFSFSQLGEAIGTKRLASRAVMVPSGKNDEDGQPILVAKTATDENGVSKRVTEKREVVEAPELVDLIAQSLASTGEVSYESAGRNAGAWKGSIPKADSSASTMRSRIAELEAQLEALTAKTAHK